MLKALIKVLVSQERLERLGFADDWGLFSIFLTELFRFFRDLLERNVLEAGPDEPEWNYTHESYDQQHRAAGKRRLKLHTEECCIMPVVMPIG